MAKSNILLIRLILAIVISIIVGRLFFPGIEPIKIVALAVIIFGLAYLFELLRKVGKGSDSGG